MPLPEPPRSADRRPGVDARPPLAPDLGHAVPASARAVDPGIGAKVAFLARPDSYPEPTQRVETVETHMSWVFLTERNAWKLKKPCRLARLDLTSLAARRANCDEELRLNRRLSSGVYLDVVPLSLAADGRLRLAPDGAVVDWLVKMRRLPAARMLDRMIVAGTATEADVRGVAARLARFYAQSAPIAMTGTEYRGVFAAGIAENERTLAAPAYGLPPALIAGTCAWQRDALARHGADFDRRAETGRIVEAHGDLRPEHICLEAEPQLIDCLEFARELRLLDPVDELAFLALECERLGAPQFAAPVFATYAAVTGDAPPAPLLAFYRSYRACIRARIAILHLDDPAPREPSKWAASALRYLQLAAAPIGRAG